MLIRHLRQARLAAGARVLDLCTGSGVLAIAAAMDGATEVTAVDISRRAVLAVRLNARLNGVSVEARRGDLFGPLGDRRFDLIMSNPPYLPGDIGQLPQRGLARAWEGGPSGRVFIERIADPAIKPQFPLKVYLPQTTDDIITAVREVKTLGEHLSVRSAGHSSNHLVLNPGGSVLVTRELNQIVACDADTMTVTVQPGVISAELDDRLSTRGLGLPVIGDHNHITVGGFASVGGISPASHRFGLFVDTVERLEYVNWDGDVITASPTENPDQFYAVLAGR